MAGYTSNTTTVTANPAPGALTPDKIGVYQNGVWYLDNIGNGTFGAGDSAYSFGAPGWTPLVGDWNATGKTLYRHYERPAVVSGLEREWSLGRCGQVI